MSINVSTQPEHKIKQDNRIFYNMVSNIYTPIHGKQTVSKLFNSLESEQLTGLCNLYKEHPLKRWNKIKTFLEKENLISDDLDVQFVIPMYINALQHYLDRTFI